VKLSTAEPELLAALQRMMALPTSLRPFVICEAATGQFVQWRGSLDEKMLLDVPPQCTAQGVWLSEFQVEYWDDTPVACERAARAGLLFLRTRFALADDAEVTITEDVTGPKGSA